MLYSKKCVPAPGCECGLCAQARVAKNTRAAAAPAVAIPMPTFGVPHAAAEAARQKADLDRRFDLHRPRSEADGDKLDELRALHKRLAALVVETTPANREQALALTHLEQSLYFAIAAIVRPPA